MMKFYLDVLPRIPAKRGNEPSQYCITTYQQAIAFFKENKKDQVALVLEAKLAQIKTGSGR
jgi:hypothetical protein